MLRTAKPLQHEDEEAPTFEGRPPKPDARKPYSGKNFNPKFKKADRAPRPPPKDPAALPKFKANGPPRPLPPSNDPIVTRDDPIWADAIFAPNVAIRENQQRKFTNVNLAAQAPITERTIDLIYKSNQALEKTLPREAFRYYSTALTWMRIIETKKNSSQALTPEELQFRELYENRKLRIPEPLLLFLRSFGSVVTINGEKYDPYFPPLPCTQLGGHGGYYSAEVYGIANHNLYEEIPCLGVVAEACRTSASDAAAGHYTPALTPVAGLQANLNLLGYAPLVNRRSEAKNIFLANGITGTEFPEDLPNTAINFALIDAVSEVLGGASAFKMQEITIPSMQPNGSRAMLLPSSPADNWNPVGVAYTNSDFVTSSLNRDTPTTFGVASVMLLQVFKEPRPSGLNPHNAWLGFNYTAEHPPPPEMIADRNIRRTDQANHGLPPRFLSNVFSSISMNARARRTLMVESLYQG
nr:TPA_asm: putative capsid protein [Pseudoglobivirus]